MKSNIHERLSSRTEIDKEIRSLVISEDFLLIKMIGNKVVSHERS